MAIRTDIYSLFEITLADRPVQFLLTRVSRREFANWNVEDEDGANGEAAAAEQSLLTAFVRQHLGFRGPFVVHKVGEMQRPPVGSLPEVPPASVEIDLWAAPTEYGDPWVVLGAAAAEDDFWRQVWEDPDITALKPIPPARRFSVRYVQAPPPPD